MVDVISLAAFKQEKLVKDLNPRLDECLEDLRWIINKYPDINPIIMCGMFASYLGRLIKLSDPELTTDLFTKSLLTVEIFARKGENNDNKNT